MKITARVLLVVLMVALMLGAVACGNTEQPVGTNPTPTAAPGETAGSVGSNFTNAGETYRFTSWQFKSENPYEGDDERSQVMRERVEDIKTKYGINIEFLTGVDTDVIRQSAFQNVPEVTGMKEGGLHFMMATYLYKDSPGNCLTPLSNHEDVYDFRNTAKFNVESQYDLCEYNNKLWFFIPVEIGVHFECGGNALLFNKRLVKEAGYEAEAIYKMVEDGTWTWDKFEQILVACNKPEKGQWGILRGHEALVMWGLANANGTEFVRLKVNEDGTKEDMFVTSDDRLMEAYDEFIKLGNQLKVMDTTYYNKLAPEPVERFANQETAWYFNGYSGNDFADFSVCKDFDYGIVPWPKGPSVVKDAEDNQYHSYYPHLNPYCVFRGVANPKGAVQILCELFTPVYDADSEEAKALYESEKMLFGRDEESRKSIDIVENAKEHFRVFMYSNAPCGDGRIVSDMLFGKGEDDILAGNTNARQYFEGISNTVNQAIYSKSPYTWK